MSLGSDSETKRITFPHLTQILHPSSVLAIIINKNKISRSNTPQTFQSKYGLNQNTALICQKHQENVINYLKETQLLDQIQRKKFHHVVDSKLPYKKKKRARSTAPTERAMEIDENE